jgi:hypothetical protein
MIYETCMDNPGLRCLKQEDTISINHNWFNGYNLDWVVRF